jgi:hypothetical protein
MRASGSFLKKVLSRAPSAQKAVGVVEKIGSKRRPFKMIEQLHEASQMRAAVGHHYPDALRGLEKARDVWEILRDRKGPTAKRLRISLAKALNEAHSVVRSKGKAIRGKPADTERWM